MALGLPAKLLRIHLIEADRFEGRPLHEAIIDKCRELEIAGASVFRGLEGYGGAAEIHRQRLLSRDQPVVIHIIDSAENIEQILVAVERMMERGVLALSDVEMIRVCHTRYS